MLILHANPDENVGCHSYTFLTNRIGEETGKEELYKVVTIDGMTYWEPLPHFASEHAWWGDVSGIETYYVVDANGRRGAMFCEEVSHEDVGYEEEQEYAKDHQFGDKDASFAILCEEAKKIEEQFPNAVVSVGYLSGAVDRHEICVFLPFGTGDSGFFKRVFDVFYEEEVA